MKKILTISAVALALSSAAYAADEKAADKQMGMMQGNMMENCQHHMKDGKMMDSMPKDMMGQCQKMMGNGGMMGSKGTDGMKSDTTKPEAPKADDSADHAKHHPAQ